MAKKILIILSEYGFWGEELMGPLEIIRRGRLRSQLCNTHRKKTSCTSARHGFPIRRSTSGPICYVPEMAEKVRAIDKSPRLDKPLNIAELMPERPYFSSHNLIRELEAYHKAVEAAGKGWLAEYDAVLIVGGSGPIVDLANNQRVHDIISPSSIMANRSEPNATGLLASPSLATGRAVEHYLGEARHGPLQGI